MCLMLSTLTDPLITANSVTYLPGELAKPVSRCTICFRTREFEIEAPVPLRCMGHHQWLPGTLVQGEYISSKSGTVILIREV